MPRGTRGRSYQEFNLTNMPVERLRQHSHTCHTTELSCQGSKGRRSWKRHKEDVQAELNSRQGARTVVQASKQRLNRALQRTVFGGYAEGQYA